MAVAPDRMVKRHDSRIAPPGASAVPQVDHLPMKEGLAAGPGYVNGHYRNLTRGPLADGVPATLPGVDAAPARNSLGELPKLGPPSAAEVISGAPAAPLVCGPRAAGSEVVQLVDDLRPRPEATVGEMNHSALDVGADRPAASWEGEKVARLEHQAAHGQIATAEARAIHELGLVYEALELRAKAWRGLALPDDLDALGDRESARRSSRSGKGAAGAGENAGRRERS